MSLKSRLKKKAKKIGSGIKSAVKTVGGVVKSAISATPVGGLVESFGGGLKDRATAAKGLIRRKRQGGSGIISTMSQDE